MCVHVPMRARTENEIRSERHRAQGTHGVLGAHARSKSRTTCGSGASLLARGKQTFHWSYFPFRLLTVSSCLERAMHRAQLIPPSSFTFHSLSVRDRAPWLDIFEQFLLGADSWIRNTTCICSVTFAYHTQNSCSELLKFSHILIALSNSVRDISYDVIVHFSLFLPLVR